MEVIDLNNYKAKKNTAVVLGNFDGIHKGHQYLIEDTIEKAKAKKLKSSLLLFKNHTKTIVNGLSNNISIITSNSQKLEILEQMGIKAVYTMNFDENIMKLTSEEFVKKILVEKLNAKLVTVGFDYRFGHKASGDSEYLLELGKKEGFETNIIMPIYVNNEIVSSTKIRNLIKLGNIKKANQFLGRNYAILGKVITGSRRGRRIGYPTANIDLSHNYVIPKTGVYQTITLLGDKEFTSLTNIGYNPTFNGEKLKIENHILNFNDNLYDKIIQIKFIDFIREDIKFNTVNELIKQIDNDVKYIKRNQ